MSSRILPLVLLVLASACASPEPEPEAVWLKGNLHTHSFWSDGDDFPESIAQWYADNGYDFLAISDHNTIAADTSRWMRVTEARQSAYDAYVAAFGEDWVDARTSGDTLWVRLKTYEEYRERIGKELLLIRSEEISDGFDGKPLHMNVTNIQEYIQPAGRAATEAGEGPGREALGSVTEVLQANVDLVLRQRERLGIPMMPHVNHPNFGWAVLAEELAVLDGERFFEVYNGHPLVRNNGDSLRMGTERMWDVVNTIRIRDGRPLMFGLAVDDAHNYHELAMNRANVGRGWVMVNAEKNDAGALVQAMESGAFYASTGVSMKSVTITDDAYRVVVEPDDGVTYTIQFIGTRKDHNRSSETIYDDSGHVLTTQFSPDIGIVLAEVSGTEATYVLDGSEMYVRARIVSDRPKNNPYSENEMEKAWTQPVIAGE